MDEKHFKKPMQNGLQFTGEEIDSICRLTETIMGKEGVNPAAAPAIFQEILSRYVSVKNGILLFGEDDIPTLIEAPI